MSSAVFRVMPSTFGNGHPSPQAVGVWTENIVRVAAHAPALLYVTQASLHVTESQHEYSSARSGCFDLYVYTAESQHNHHNFFGNVRVVSPPPPPLVRLHNRRIATNDTAKTFQAQPPSGDHLAGVMPWQRYELVVHL